MTDDHRHDDAERAAAAPPHEHDDEGTHEPSHPQPDAPAADAAEALPVRRADAVRGVVARAASAVLVVACAASVVVLADEVPRAGAVAAPVAGVAVQPGATTWVCPGAVRVPTEPDGEDVAYDPQFDPQPAEQESSVVAVARSGTPTTFTVLGGRDELREPSGVPVSVSEVPGSERTPLLSAGPVPTGSIDAGAAVVSRTVRGDLRGLVGASCQVPAPQIWLVGGSTSLGSSARLVLQNPGRTPATVEVRLWGPSGRVELAGAPQYLVPPGEERVVLLEGVAAEQRRLAVQLLASGGLVTAHLQDSALRGLVPAGADQVVAGTPPATRQVVPGVSAVGTPAGGRDAAVLRLLAPGDRPTTARVRLLGPSGAAVLPGTEEVDLTPGEVLDLPLSGLPAGTWTVLVEADVPVVAGAMITRGEGVGATGAAALEAPLERAWLPSAAPGTTTPLALPAGGAATLSLGSVASTGTATVGVEVVGPDGSVLATRQVEVAPSTTVTLPVADLAGDRRAAAVRLSGDTRWLAWAAVVVDRRDDGNLVTALVPVPPAQAPGEVPVRVE